MTKASKQKFYGVRGGRQGHKVYDSWNECKADITRFPGARHKSFLTKAEAEAWAANFCEKNNHESITAMERPRIAQQNPDMRRLPSAEQKRMDVPMSPYHSERMGPSVKLSPQQMAVLKSAEDGNNVFFTGSAGTGKSVLLREIIRYKRKLYQNKVAVTASTGIAAINIGGMTLHSWAGIGLGRETAGKYVKEFSTNPEYHRVKSRWRETRVLVIDEISMIDGALFDKLEYIGRRLRRNESPFGGIQLIISGDFAQLPPVPNKLHNVVVPIKFAFEAKSWESCVGIPVTLTKVFRQKDKAFVDMLNAMRFGQLDEETTRKFQALSRIVKYNDGIEPTELYSLRGEVEYANSTRLNMLKSEPMTYHAVDIPGRDVHGNVLPMERMKRLLDQLIAPTSITIKVGAQVMLIKNIAVESGLVNGSVGVVTRFMMFSEAVMEFIQIVEPEVGARPKLQRNPGAPELKNERERTRWPLVRFTNGSQLLCVGSTFTIDGPNETREATRVQVPLILSWALSIHKSQGQTLERVKVDLSGVFEKGQAYVALSRATSMNTLQVLYFNPAKIQAHHRVLEWHEKLQVENKSPVPEDPSPEYSDPFINETVEEDASSPKEEDLDVVDLTLDDADIPDIPLFQQDREIIEISDSE